jgi:hypothetical protein
LFKAVFFFNLDFTTTGDLTGTKKNRISPENLRIQPTELGGWDMKKET